MSFRDMAMDAGIHHDTGMTLDQAAAFLEEQYRQAEWEAHMEEQQEQARAEIEPFVDETGRSLHGRCSTCRRHVDNFDPEHRVTAIVHGGKGVECAVRGDITAAEAGPLRDHPAAAHMTEDDEPF